MPFLTLSGITVPVLATTGGSVTTYNVGEYGRSFGGTPYSAVRARGPEYAGSWPLVPRATSTAYRLLVQGAGEGWRFNTAGSGSSAYLYSSKGVTSSSTGTPSGGTIETFTTGGPVSNGPRLSLPEDGFVTWALAKSPLNEATISFWVKATTATGGVWKHVVIESTGSTATAGWLNGVSTALGSIPFSGSFYASNFTTNLEVLMEASGEAASVAEVMVFPFRASTLEATWAAWPYNSGSGRAAEDFPYLTMAGSWPAAGTDSVLGELGQEGLADVGSSLYASGEFTLRSRTLSP